MSNETNNESTVHEVKVTVNGERKPVHLTINWKDITPEQERELAARSIAIKWQNEVRSQGIVPETREEIDAVDYALGRARKPMDPMKALGKLSNDQLQELLKARGLI